MGSRETKAMFGKLKHKQLKFLMNLWIKGLQLDTARIRLVKIPRQVRRQKIFQGGGGGDQQEIPKNSTI